MDLSRFDNQRVIRAPRGPELNARSWQTEAPLRMLMNNLDAEVAENPQELVVYGGIGRAARDWRCYDVLVETLKRLATTRRCCVQSGKPVGVFRTHPDAPRVLIANSNLVAHWATWDKFHALDRLGLMMYGQMTAGSWIYIGSQGIIQGTYETFVEAGRQHYDGDLAGKWILTGGLGGMGGAQPLAATMAGACLLAVECRASRIERRLESRYLDRMATGLDEALGLIEQSCAARRALSVGLLGNAAEVFPELVRRGVLPESGDRPDRGARSPARLSAGRLDSPAMGGDAAEGPRRRGTRGKAIDGGPGARHARLPPPGRADPRLRQQHPPVRQGEGGRQRVRVPGLRPGLHPASVLPRQGAVPLGRAVGRPRGHLPDRRQGEGAVPGRPPFAQLAGPGPASASGSRACRRGSAGSGLGERARVGLAFNDMVASGELSAPVVIGRDHLDSGSVASPNRETEAMQDGSDAIADWPLLNALLNIASGATWVSIHHGGGVGIGFSQHAGMVIVCDGTPMRRAASSAC